MIYIEHLMVMYQVFIILRRVVLYLCTVSVLIFLKLHLSFIRKRQSDIISYLSVNSANLSMSNCI